jgi:hypothetical protein
VPVDISKVRLKSGGRGGVERETERERERGEDRPKDRHKNSDKEIRRQRNTGPLPSFYESDRDGTEREREGERGEREANEGWYAPSTHADPVLLWLLPADPLHLHGQCGGHDPRAAAGPHGDHPAQRVR